MTQAAGKARGERYSRRGLLAGGAAAGLTAWTGGASGDPAALGRQALTPESVASCEEMLALAYTDDERAQILSTLDDQLDAIRALRGVDFENTDAPALVFDPRLPGRTYPEQTGGVSNALPMSGSPPADEAEAAFAPLVRQAYWLRGGHISARELAEIYLERIRRYRPLLRNFITVTEELALAQADRADRELAAGTDRGPLHGIPYGVKDLVDTADLRTTWGAAPYRDRVAPANAWIIDRLEQAGAILLGKTTTGALAFGDEWFGGRTRNPWNPEEGSSGSSAGSASATAAGMCSFALGTETMGSVVTPASRCGTVGLRPSFGRVPRTGTMALCWSLDKIGPLSRATADAGLVLEAINGRDRGDPSSLGHGFAWDAARSVEGMRVGYMPHWFDGAPEADKAALAALRAMPVNLVELSLPNWPYTALFNALEIEAAAAFQELTLSNSDDELSWQADRAWPNTWRRAHFVSAVDSVQLDRFRRKVMRMVDSLFSGIDAIISPEFGDPLLLITTFTGHPCLTLRAGYSERSSRPPIGADPEPGADAPTFTVPENVMLWAPLFEERRLLTLGSALERALAVWRDRPPLDRWMEPPDGGG